MSTLSTVLSPLSRAVRAFFSSDVRLQRKSGGLQIVLAEARKPDRGPPSGPRKADARARREDDLMVRELTTLLDQLPENRKVLRHLALVEKALRKKGPEALEKVPYALLKQALQQFEGVVMNWSNEGLACLRSKMAVALIEREPEGVGPGGVEVTAIESAPLAVPETLEGEAAADAEAALLAAYGAAALPGLDLSTSAEAGGRIEAEMHGELNSPSARAIDRATQTAVRDEKVELDIRVLPT